MEVRVTKDDAFSAELVSPKFVVASKICAVVQVYIFKAVERCKNIGRELEDGTYYEKLWHMEVPTLAELEVYGLLQDASPAVNYLFNTNGTYWCAMPYWYYDFRGK